MIDYSEVLMSNNGDGTYSYNLVVEKPGIISILIYSRQSNYIESFLYTGNNLNGIMTPAINSTINNRNIMTYESSTHSSYWKGPT